MQFKIYPGEMICIQKEQTLLSRGMNMIVMLKLYHRQDVISVVLSFIYE